jgi:hypothetical protein
MKGRAEEGEEVKTVKAWAIQWVLSKKVYRVALDENFRDLRNQYDPVYWNIVRVEIRPVARKRGKARR